jgi:hypothetical protein
VTGGISYVLPIRVRAGDGDLTSLTEYLRWLAERAEVVVVDGSDGQAFADHHRAWRGFAVHARPAPDLRCSNGKVQGVLTGLRLATHEHVVIADDDVRYDEEGLRTMRELLADGELVRPQNYFEPLPWHARWDTARTLLNRAIAHDYPGTLGVRASFLRSIGGYDGDVLFENLELIRTVRAAGGRVLDAPALFVRRRPPTFGRFLEQRPRQAYDDWAQPLRFAGFLAIAPGTALAARTRPRILLLGALASVLAAAGGRLRHRGSRVFDRLSPLLAPAWLAERALLSWVALALRVVRGGCPYGGSVIVRAATPERVLRRRFGSRAEVDRGRLGG